jgi:hypothetical protein
MGARAPAIWVLLFIFVCKNRLERAAMQVEIKHIRGEEYVLWHNSPEKFIDRAIARDPNGCRSSRGRVCSNK